MVGIHEFFDPPALPTNHDEVEMVRSELESLGVTDPHGAVAAWMGKPNIFTGHIMTNVQEVVDFFHQQIKATSTTPLYSEQVYEDKLTPVPASLFPVPEEVAQQVHNPVNVVSSEYKTRMAEHQHALAAWRAQCLAANEAWRAAVQQRAEHMQQWDVYVRQLREAYQDLKRSKP